MTHMKLIGRHAVVTGGSRGLGAAMATRLAGAGASVTVVYREQTEVAEKFIASLPGPGVHHALAADLSDQSDIARLVSELGAGDTISILVNNAGRILRPSSWTELTYADAATTYAEHVIAPIMLIQALAPAMASQSYGRIVNIHTTYADKGSSAVLAYTSAKSALATVTTAMARELGSKGVTVNGIAPGNFDTGNDPFRGPRRCRLGCLNNPCWATR